MHRFLESPLRVRVAFSLGLLLGLGCATPPAFEEASVEIDCVGLRARVVSTVEEGSSDDELQEIEFGRFDFYVFATLDGLTPGHPYEVGITVWGPGGGEVVESFHTLVATKERETVWRRVRPDWKVHGAGRWLASVWVGCAFTEVPFYVVDVRGGGRQISFDEPTVFRTGLTSAVTSRGTRVDDLYEVPSGRPTWIYFEVGGLTRGQNYELYYAIESSYGRLIEGAIPFSADTETKVLTAPLPKGVSSGVWALHGKLEGTSRSIKFRVLGEER